MSLFFAVVAPATPNPKTPTKRKRGKQAAAATTVASPATPSSKPAPAKAAAKALHSSVDPLCKLPGGKVLGEFSCMLNQTNVAAGANNNKYYRIQLLTDAAGKKFFVWTRWGRVGEDGQVHHLSFSLQHLVPPAQERVKRVHVLLFVC